jgi:amidase
MTLAPLRAAALLLLAAPALAQTSVTGRWFVTTDVFGTPQYQRLDLTQQGEKLTGNLGGAKLEGTVTGTTLHAFAKDPQGGGAETSAIFKDGKLTGTVIWTDSDPLTPPETHTFSAFLVTPRTPIPPQRHEFAPTAYYREFSAKNPPVLTVNPGDTIHTTTVDAGGTDFKGVHRVMGGNPETGPFYIASALPGDTLVVHITRLKLNRDYAVSGSGLVGRAMGPGLAVRMKDAGDGVRWNLNREAGTASPAKPGEHMGHFAVPLRPMLGCIAVAPRPAQAAPQTGDSGDWGGNMDFNELTEGATLYLPVYQPGALLYFGDGHAAQGDGELTGDALETSMDVELTVDIIPAKRIPSRRVETTTHLIAMGLDGSLDDAFKSATQNMATWLADDYKLTPVEIAELFGSAAEYHVSEAADRNAGIVLKLPKSVLATLTKPAK